MYSLQEHRRDGAKKDEDDLTEDYVNLADVNTVDLGY